MSHQVIYAKVKSDQVQRVTEEAEEEGGTVVSSHDNGDGTTNLTISFPDAAAAGPSGATKVVKALLHSGAPLTFTSF
ncbi:hypothetical protein QH494_26095 [Sphingomonas sp. AR_OL41]|uniref:hypothetical protein n=1 Tax=Sphingomonas sp. AR_OL41 TaxID=3042729 RepID=UPI0024810EA5|nr:hypothetical protein [Sphingomonas sp. AR_OL41]MDH7975672.1 hypothetical protein [Sphingomonas sp. AR_OL41]